GDDVYNETGVGQTRSRFVSPGERNLFLAEVQNDGSVLDGVGLQGCGSTSAFTVRYRDGTTPVTVAVVSGVYETASVAPGVAGTIKVAITAAPDAVAGATLRCKIAASSVTDATRRDVVAVKLTVS